MLRQVEALLRRREPLHLQDAHRDGHGGQVDPGAGLLEAHRVVDGGERDAAVPCRGGRERERGTDEGGFSLEERVGRGAEEHACGQELRVAAFDQQVRK